MKLIALSPAKLNLFLHVVGRREDGYHELQTVFQLLNYGDVLEFGTNSSSEIVLLNTLGIPIEENLIYKAAKCLQAYTGTKQGAVIKIEKSLPMGGGLGGGSSNAATTLVALDYLWQTSLSTDQLAELGETLGADVPVFVRGYTAWGEGIGERLTPIALPEHWYVVITPPCNVATAQIFEHEGLTRNTPRITMDQFLTGDTHNDLEPLVRKLYPEVNNALNWLSQFAVAKMTGSGSSVFAQFPDEITAQRVLLQLPNTCHGFVASGVNSSPLHCMFKKMSHESM